MVIGNVIMIVSSILLYFGTRIIGTGTCSGCAMHVLCYFMHYMLSDTHSQTACTRSGQTCLTNDPKQRPMFTIFNTIASLIGMGLVQFLAPILGDRLGGYNSANFFDFMIPLAIVVSAVLTLLAVIGIWEKDRPEFFGVGNKQEKVKLKEYVAILKANKELQRLMVAGAGCKLAFSIATNMTVLCMLYGAMMGDYGGLYLPMMIRRIYFLCSVLPFDGKDITEAWTESFTGALYNACTGHVHWSFSVVVVMESGGSGI